ncbi:coiled-coil domain-containing protein 87 [Sceloporus undulatus]|uniref:coiled-coil domain-containing protein 87 n=1 Tax=Sceloporus undulatus TaxID=8520 RepID=UPI001C4AF983|nr:coiled-coil domain-containing protein 87 [Sceloporus undulatus]
MASSSSSSSPLRGLYPLEETAVGTQELHDQYQRILAPLSLFPTSHSRVRQDPFRREPSFALRPSSSQRAIPVPISLVGLLQLVKQRLELGPRWGHIPTQHQKTFREIILTEVRHIYKDVQGTLYDPAFGSHTNRELYQHLVMYIGLVCQHLFLHYLCLMEHRGALGVFTDCANLTRFSSQLSLDCSAFLNVAAVHHRLVMEMKTLGSHTEVKPPKPVSPLSHRPAQKLGCRLGFTISHFIRMTRPHTQTVRQKVAQDIKELEEIPRLDMRKIKDLHLPLLTDNHFFRQMACAAIKTPCPTITRQKSKSQQAAYVFKRSQSLPNMRVGKLLADELGIRLTPRRLSPDLPCHYTDFTEDTDLDGSVGLAEDLRRLVQGSVLKSSPWKDEQDDDLDLPPLIKALTWRRSNEARLEYLQRMLVSLQQEENTEMRRRNTIIAAPASHPQAATVNFEVHDKMVVKAADMQVSERVYLDEVVLERFPPIYNHLLGEIDNATLKSLDASLSMGEEVREMYKELMNTIPKDHMKFDLGPSTEPPATNIDLSVCFASSTLYGKKSDQIINEQLSEILPAGPFAPEEVVDTLQTPNLPFKKSGSKKQHASWLKWWKKTFNVDDYLKYLSTNEADFLPVIFHLYNFEGDVEEELRQRAIAEAETKKREKARRDTIKQAAELQFKQEKVEPGKWNPGGTMTEEPDIFALYDHKPEDLRAMQRRLERLWTVLHFPEGERLDMAIKYSSRQYYYFLPDMLQAWERAAQTIQERELLLAELEKFEQTASDPNRLFSKEPQAFARRMQESRTRWRLRSELAQYDAELYLILTHIKEEFGDTVTFRGRPYPEKMQWDTVEMLYWLEQKRRVGFLKRQLRRRNQTWKLPPLS